MNSKDRQGCLLTLIKAGYDRGYSLCQSGVYGGKWYLMKNGCGFTIYDSRVPADENTHFIQYAVGEIFSEPVALKG